MDYMDLCPAPVVERVQRADLRDSDNASLFSDVAGASSLECQVAVLVAVAKRLKEDADPSVFDDFAGALATYARFLDPTQIEQARGAYLRVPYQPHIALNYFGGLRAARIDILEHLRGRIEEDWSFEQPRQDAATWHYYMYLASLGEPGALDRLAEKIAATRNGNDATNLLASLAELKAPGVAGILRSYAEDMRTADATEGPGPTIAESVRMFLMLNALP